MSMNEYEIKDLLDPTILNRFIKVSSMPVGTLVDRTHEAERVYIIIYMA